MISGEITKKIGASALVYCRTYCCDYNAGFLLRPCDFTEETVAWAKPYISSAVSYCDELKGIRQVVFGNEQHLIFGIAGILSSLLGKEFLSFTSDEYGRNIKCFLGFVLHMEEKERGYFTLADNSDYKKIFSEHIAKDEVWKNKMPQCIQLGYDERVFILKHTGKNMDFKTGEKISISDGNGDKELFEQVLSEISAATCKNISLCTNMYNVKMIQSSPYIYRTAGEAAVAMYKKIQGKESAESVNSPSSEHSPPREADIEICSETDKERKGNPFMCAVIIAVAILCGIIVYLCDMCCEKNPGVSGYENLNGRGVEWQVCLTLSTAV